METNLKTVTLAPHTTDTGYTFESGLFGLNTEITRKGFFGGLCAQMLNNRKLYMGTDGVDGWVCEGFERITDRPQESLCQSHFVILKDGGSMSQSSPVIALRAGETYEAKAWVRALTPTATVTFGVAGMEQTLSLEADENAYRELAFTFAGCDLEEGSFSIRVTGEVAVYELSLMPVNHFHGMRWDVIEALRKIAPTSIRFPGGCAADHFDWKESLKAPEFRKPADGTSKAWFLFRDSYHQDSLEIGLNEFVWLCREIGAEPEYTVSLILSDGEDARRLVEYCNGAPDTEYGAKREALGLSPFGIRLWYVGNEAYFFGGEYQGSVAAAKRTDELVAAMRLADPSISVAIGLTWGYAYRQWAKEFMDTLTCDYEYVSYHDYIGILPDATQGENGMATTAMLEDNFIDGECFGLNFYRNELYAHCFDRIRICVDEWNYTWGKDSSNALFFSNALQFHFLAKGKETYHIDRSEFFMPVNEGMITVRGNLCRMESTGELFRLMAGHKGGEVIPCGAETTDLDVLCTKHGDELYLSVVNRRSEACRPEVAGYTVTGLTEIHTGEYSFENNDFAVEHPAEPIVHGHSVLFMTLKEN
jgi:alpha-N-arabinofuranosidase